MVGGAPWSNAVPAVSVLIAARDAATTLPACLRSVQRQSLADWECVVVDDASTDQTRAIVDEFAHRDPRFRLLPTDLEGGEVVAHGVVTSRNLGLEQCRGKWIAILDADDWMHRERLRLQVGALQQHPWHAVGAWPRFFQGFGPGTARYQDWLRSMRSADDLWRQRFIEMPLAHPAMMLRADTLRRLGGYRDQGWPEDYDLFLRLCRLGTDALGVVPRVLHAWRVRPESLSRTSPAYTTQAFTRCRAAFLAADFLGPEHASFRLGGYGATGKALVKALATHGCHPHSIYEVHPRRIGRHIAAAPVHPWEALGPPAGPPLIVSVAGAAPRQRVRDFLLPRGWREGTDFVCAA